MKRWFVLFFVALVIGSIGLLVHQNYLEAIGLVIALLAIALFIWSSVRFSLEVRPPTTGRRFRSIRIPRVSRRIRVRRSHTEELHAAIFEDPNVE